MSQFELATEYMTPFYQANAFQDGMGAQRAIVTGLLRCPHVSQEAADLASELLRPA